MTERREGQFEGQGGVELFYQTWTPSGASATNPTLVITHGLAEHSECYSRTAEKLVAFGWRVIAWDMRGHGRSEGKRGFVDEFRTYALDLGFLLRHLHNGERLSPKFALFGHSMGGLVTLRHVIDRDATAPKPMALALSSPLLGVALAVPPIKDMAARAFKRFLPSITLNNGIRYEDLTRDTELIKGYATDPLRHDKIAPTVYLGMIDNMEMVKSQASLIRIPTLLQAAGVDKIVSLAEIREFFPKIGTENKKLIVYDESYHEIFNDLDREKVLSDLDAFLVDALGIKK